MIPGFPKLQFSMLRWTGCFEGFAGTYQLEDRFLGQPTRSYWYPKKKTKQNNNNTSMRQFPSTSNACRQETGSSPRSRTATIFALVPKEHRTWFTYRQGEEREKEKEMSERFINKCCFWNQYIQVMQLLSVPFTALKMGCSLWLLVCYSLGTMVGITAPKGTSTWAAFFFLLETTYKGPDNTVIGYQTGRE